MNLLLSIFLVMLIPVALIIIIFSFLGKNELNKINVRQREIENLLKNNNFTYSQLFTSDDKKSGMVFDGNDKIGIFKYEHYNWQFEEIDAKDILQSEIIEDGISIMRTSKKDVIVGATIGSVFGATGAIIGGLTRDKINIEEVKKLQLQIVINDTSSPIKKVNFINKDYTIKKSSPMYTLYYDRIKHWQKLIDVLIKNTEKQNETLNS
jgi:2C-methyl-D-erythritol 2,4-cyclodiphosphate synthase